MEAIMNVKPHHTQKELQTFYRTENNAKLARRIHGVYLARKGLPCPQIMEITGSARRTVQQWIHKYNAGGIEVLKDSPRPGQPTKLSRKKEQAFCERIAAGPTDQDGVSVFHGTVIQQILEREFGASYSLWGTYQLLYRLGYSCLCPRPQHEKADPGLQEEFKKTSSRHWIRSNQNIPTKK
jgi:transposase